VVTVEDFMKVFANEKVRVEDMQAIMREKDAKGKGTIGY